MTIGVDFQTINVKSGDMSFKLTVWDLAGQDRFASFRENFYRGARAVAMVFDVTDRQSFEDLPRWLQETKTVIDHNRFLVIGNKIDMPNRVIETAEGKQYAIWVGTADGVPGMLISTAEMAPPNSVATQTETRKMTASSGESL